MNVDFQHGLPISANGRGIPLIDLLPHQFDEVVVVLFVGSAGQQTLPWQMFTGLREQISPTILAVATLMVAISIVLLTVLEMLRRRSERLRGLAPQ